MGLNDMAEQLQSAREDAVRLEADNDALRKEALAWHDEALGLAVTLAAVRTLTTGGNVSVMRRHAFLKGREELWDELRAILDSSPAQHQTEREGDYYEGLEEGIKIGRAVIHEAAEAVRAHATAPSELTHPHVQIDALIVWVADWIESPPEWVHVSYRTEQGEAFADRMARQTDDVMEADLGVRPNGTKPRRTEQGEQA